MGALRYVAPIPAPPEAVDALLRDPARFERLLPTFLAIALVEYPSTPARVSIGTRVEFVPYVFPRRWRISSALAASPPGEFLWVWKGGPMRGTEAWRIETAPGGSRLVVEVAYLEESFRERAFWALVGRPAHAVSAWDRGRRLRRLAKAQNR